MNLLRIEIQHREANNLCIVSVFDDGKEELLDIAADKLDAADLVVEYQIAWQCQAMPGIC